VALGCGAINLSQGFPDYDPPAEVMEAAKHNFLFKSYFERRGYQEQAPFEIRERAIRASQEEIERRQRELLDYEQRLRARAAAQGTTLDSLGGN